MDFGGLTIVQDYLVWTLADMVLSNLKTGRDESPRGVESHLWLLKIPDAPKSLELFLR